MNWLINKKVKVAVHDGHFHPDDVFAVAILSLYLKKPLKIFRTRDERIFKKMEYLLDVGREYNSAKNRFDHHQENVPVRSNGIPYATSGLVWKEFGDKISGSNEVADLIDQKIIQTVDAMDSGVDIHKKIFTDVEPYFFIDYIISLNPSWTESQSDYQEAFEEGVRLVKEMLTVEIKKAQDHLLARKKIDGIYEKTLDKRLIVLDFNCNWKAVVEGYPETLIVVRPVEGDWWASCVSVKGEKFKNRINFPSSWAGKVNNELAKITGVSDAKFCHKNLFMCSAGSKAGAIALAELAINKK